MVVVVVVVAPAAAAAAASSLANFFVLVFACLYVALFAFLYCYQLVRCSGFLPPFICILPHFALLVYAVLCSTCHCLLIVTLLQFVPDAATPLLTATMNCFDRGSTLHQHSRPKCHFPQL